MFKEFKPSKDKSTGKDTRAIVLLDQEEFYGITLDLVLYNLKQESSLKVQSSKDFDQFNRQLAAKAFKQGIYIVDEFFGQGAVDIAALLKSIKQNDPEAKIISYTVSQPEELENKESYDFVIVKSTRDTERTVLKVLSEILGVEFIADNSDPEQDKE